MAAGGFLVAACCLRFAVAAGQAGCSGAIIAAASKGDEDQLSYILDQGLEHPSCQDADGRTPLHHAAEYSQVPAMLKLLAAGAVMSTDSAGKTPLHDAANQGHTASCDLLLQAGAYVEFPDGAWRTPLHLAARRGHDPAVRLLLDHQADILAADGDRRTALHFSVRSDAMLNTTVLLCDRGADIESQDIVGMRPLHIACIDNQLGTTELLLGRGADVYALDAQGFNPLVHAAGRGHEAVGRAILFRLLGPADYAPPVANLVGQAEQDQTNRVFGLPGYALAMLISAVLGVLVVTPWMRHQSRRSKHKQAYQVQGGDQAIDEFMEGIMLHVLKSSEEQKKLALVWEALPAHALSDVHRPRAH